MGMFQGAWFYYINLFVLISIAGEGDGTLLQYQNPMDGGAW